MKSEIDGILKELISDIKQELGNVFNKYKWYIKMIKKSKLAKKRKNLYNQ